MAFDLKRYKTIIFDCDGVILDSNRIKTDAFYELGLQYGEEIACQIRDYHQVHGGISRFHKMLYLHEKLLKSADPEQAAEKDIRKYGDLVKCRLIDCPMTDGFLDLMRIPEVKNAICIVVSGSYQVELREIFEERGLAKYFNGIYGSPDTKIEIVGRELRSQRISEPAVVIGDSKADYIAAREFGMDFVFMWRHTEFEDWDEYFRSRPVTIIEDFGTALAGTTSG